MYYFRYFILSIALLLGLNLFGQAPGYLGKRLFIEGQFGLNSALAKPNFNHIKENNHRIYTFIPRLCVNWIIGRHKYISIEGDYRQYFEVASPLLAFPGQPSLKYRIDIQSIVIGYYTTKKRSGRSLAPLGRFLGVKLSYNQSNATPVKYADSNNKFDGVERAAYYLNYQTPELSYFSLIFSTGNRKILADKFTLIYTFDIGYRFPLDVKSSNDDMRLHNYDLNDLIVYNNIYFNLSIGTGILLF